MGCAAKLSIVHVAGCVTTEVKVNDAYSSTEASDEAVLLHSRTRAFAVHIHNIQAQIKSPGIERKIRP